jgi:hypothetical protein
MSLQTIYKLITAAGNVGRSVWFRGTVHVYGGSAWVGPEQE